MVQKVIWIGFVLRLIVGAWNAFYGPSFGATGDALGFHLFAVEYARNLEMDRFIFGVLYAYALGLVYHFTTDSQFLGDALSCVAWLISAHVLLKVMQLLSYSGQQRSYVMLLYALLPSSILLTGVTLREAYQLLFVNLMLYASLQILLRGSRRHWVALALPAFAGGLLQPGLLLFGVYIVLITSAAVFLRRGRRLPLARLALIVPLTALVLAGGFIWFSMFYGGFDLQGIGVIGAIESYQRNALSIYARSHYKTSVELDSPTDLLFFVPIALFQYLFEPMPWRDLGWVDLPAIFENLLRAALIWKALTGLFHRRLRWPSPFFVILSSYFVLETVFAIGTINWGTSARHHIPGIGLLLLAAFAYPRRRAQREVAAAPAEREFSLQRASA